MTHDPFKEFIAILSPYLTEQLLISMYPVTSRDYDICRSGCHLFMDDNKKQCPKSSCKKNRYRCETKKIPYTSMCYLPLSEQLASLVSHAATREQLCDASSMSSGSAIMKDIFDGDILNGAKEWGRYDFGLMVFVDGFQPFIHSSASMTIVHLVILNYPPEKRYLS